MSMDFDNGNAALIYQIKARFRAAIDAENIPWGELLQRAGVTNDEVQRAFDPNGPGPLANRHIIAALASALGRDENWALSGSGECLDRFKQPLLERVLKLTWEYIYKANVPKDERAPLIEQIRNVVGGLRANTLQAAHRAGVPQTWKEVAWMHRQITSRRHQ